MSYLKKTKYRRCSRCIMDTSIPEIRFDAEGICQYCHIHDVLDEKYPLDENSAEHLREIIEEIKTKGKGRKYDCVVGISGGRDSVWTLYTAVKLGLRPLAVHFDNGWNSEVAVKNILNAVSKLNIDLETVVADWEEFKDLQIAFLRASTPDVEVPTDLAIHSVLHKIAAKERISYVLNGHSFRTEGVAPIGWTYFDGKYISAVQKMFGTKRLKDFNNFGIFKLILYSFIYRIKVVPILNYSPYNQAKIDQLLKEELDWQYYGGHHHESIYTKFIQTYLLPKKFNIDKRKTEFSALIRSGQLNREDAINEIANQKYEFDESLVDYSIRKLGISKEEWIEIINQEPRSFMSYPSYYPLMKLFKQQIKLATKLKLLPDLLYLKYLS